MSLRQQRALAGLILCVVATCMAWQPVWSLDWGWHLATLERLLSEGRLPIDDVFSYSTTHPYEPVHLVFQFVLGGLVGALGLEPGLMAFRLAANVALGLSLFVALGRRGLGPWAGLALCLLVLAGCEHRLMVRPHLFTWICVVLLIDILAEYRAGRTRTPWALVPLFLLWTNSHPAVVYGVLTAVGFVVGEATWARLGVAGAMTASRLRTLSLWVGLSILTTFVGPLGPGLYPYLIRHRDMQAELRNQELGPLLPPFGSGQLLGLILLLGAAALIVRHRRRLDRTLVLGACAFFGLALLVARELALALIVTSLAVAPLVAVSVRALRGRRRAAPAVFALALVPVALTCARLERTWGLLATTLRPGRFPVQAADWIAEHRPRGRIYNTSGAGSYLVYRLAPRRAGGEGWLIHSDGRMPMFYEALKEGRAGFEVIDRRWHPEIVVVDFLHGAEQFHALERSALFLSTYRLVHVSSGGKVYLRRGAGNDPLIAREGYQELRYLGQHWSGSIPQLPGPSDLARFRAEVQRARRLDPALPYLPPE